MSDHIPDPTKMIQDTPRTDAAYFKPAATMYDLAGDMKRIERELNAANDRIKRLEEALDCLTLVVGLTPILGNKDALQEAFDLARAALKAKEAKP